MQAAGFVQIDDFLREDERSPLLDYVLSRESEFVPTTTSTGETDYRRSQILYWFPDYSDWMVQRVAAVVPEVFQRLGMAQAAIEQIEIQLTAHNDGHYYKIHNDNGSTEAATRVLSYVYYFHRHPKAFTGGELQLYHPDVEYGATTQTDGFQLIEPCNNRIVFFPSGYLHAVMPVVCPSQAFPDSRFTLNGWVRQV